MGSDNFMYIYSSVKYYGMAVGVGVSVFIFRNEIEHFFEKYTGSQYFKRKHGANCILEPIEIDEEPHYVERKETEERLNQIIGTLSDRKYVIIVGCKGSGKSTVLEHVINGKKGIVVVYIDGETTLSNFKHQLLEAINVKIEPWNQSILFSKTNSSFR
jgi:predicted ATP-dependent serine protease